MLKLRIARLLTSGTLFFSLLICAALIPVLTGYLFSFCGIDSYYHIHSWSDIVYSWHHGVIAPGWASHADFGLGDARYVFYPPLMMLAGGLLTALLPAQAVLGVIVFAAFLVSGLSMYRLGLELTDTVRARAAALLYVLSFYLQITALIHAAYAELAVNAFLPLLVLCFIRTLEGSPARAAHGKSWQYLACLIGCSVLTDVPISGAILICLFFASAWRSIYRRSIAPLLLFLSAAAVAGLCCSFYLLPAFRESHAVESVDGLPFSPFTLFSNHVHVNVLLSVLAIVALCMVVYGYVRAEDSWRGQALRIICVLAIVAFLFQLPLMNIFWRSHLGRIIGVPHRFMGFLAIGFALSATAYRAPRWLPRASAVLVAITTLAFIFGTRTWMLENKRPVDVATVFQSTDRGYEGVREYLPKFIPWIRDDKRSQIDTLPEVSTSTPGCTAAVLDWQPQKNAIEVRTPTPCTLTLKLYQEGFWTARRDGTAVDSRPNASGLLTMAVPAGTYRLVTSFRRPYAMQILGWVLSIFGVGILLAARRLPFAQNRLPLVR